MWPPHQILNSQVLKPGSLAELLLYLTVEAPHLFTWKMGIIIAALLMVVKYEIIVLKITESLPLLLMGWVASYTSLLSTVHVEIGNICVAVCHLQSTFLHTIT